MSEYDRFVIACANADLEVVEALKDRHLPDLNDDDSTLISHVAQMDNWDAVRLMVDLGWPIDAKGWMDATPLYWTLCKGHPEALGFLLRRGASTEPIGGYFQHPVHTTVYCQWNRGKRDYPAALEILLEHGLAIPDGFHPCGNEAMARILSRYVNAV